MGARLNELDMSELFQILADLDEQCGCPVVDAVRTVVYSGMGYRLIHLTPEALRVCIMNCTRIDPPRACPLNASVLGRAQYLLALQTEDQSCVEDESLLHVLVDCVLPSAQAKANSVQWLNRGIIARITSRGVPSAEDFRVHPQVCRAIFDTFALLLKHTLDYAAYEYEVVTQELLHSCRAALSAGLQAGWANDYVAVLLETICPFADFWDEARQLFERAPEDAAGLLLRAGARAAATVVGAEALSGRVDVFAGLVPFFLGLEDSELAQSAFASAAICLADPELVPRMLALASETALPVDGAEVETALASLEELVLQHHMTNRVIESLADAGHVPIVQSFLSGLACNSDDAWRVLRSNAAMFECIIQSSGHLAAKLLRVVAIREPNELASWCCIALDAHAGDNAIFECVDKLEMQGEPAPTALELACCERPLGIASLRILLRRMHLAPPETAPINELPLVCCALSARGSEPVSALVSEIIGNGSFNDQAFRSLSEASLGLLADVLTACEMHDECASVIAQLSEIDSEAATDFALSVLAGGGRIEIPLEVEVDALVALATRMQRSAGLPALIGFVRLRFCRIAETGDPDAIPLAKLLTAFEEPAEVPHEVIEAMLFVAFTMDSPAQWPGPFAEFLACAAGRPDVDLSVLRQALGTAAFPGRQIQLTDEVLSALVQGASGDGQAVSAIARLARDAAVLRQLRFVP
jgi:hypothetical protein